DLQERERKERPTLYATIHRTLFEWYSVRCDNSDPKTLNAAHERAFLTALRHLCKVDEREAVQWSNRQMTRFHSAARWRALEVACLTVLPFASRAFGPDDQWTMANLAWLAAVYRETGRYAEAETLFKQVRAVE